jgi:hypothetical protein
MFILFSFKYYHTINSFNTHFNHLMIQTFQHLPTPTCKDLPSCSW